MAAPTRRPPSRHREMDESEPADNSSKMLGWAIYASIVLGGFVFGVVAGNMRPKTIEVVKTVPAEAKPEPKNEKKDPEPKKELTPKTPEPKPEVKSPDPEPKPPVTKTPDPEPKPPEPKPPEPKPPEPKTTPPEPKITAVLFDKEVKPILISKCNNCHGAVGKPKGGLDLRTLASIGKGGDNGAALKGGDLKNSLIWTTISDGAMPPEGKEQLTEKEKTLIKNWILSGGK